ncbi:MAG TPA: hypothetical protein VF474_05395, partial [Phenylobacterium sp.]
MPSWASPTAMLHRPPIRFGPWRRRASIEGPRPVAPRRDRRRRGAWVALTVSFGLHLAIIGYLAQARFEPRYRVYAEDVTSVELVRPIPPPPPPPPPPTPETPPPRTPPKLQPRPPVQVTALPAD